MSQQPSDQTKSFLMRNRPRKHSSLNLFPKRGHLSMRQRLFPSLSSANSKAGSSQQSLTHAPEKSTLFQTRKASGGPHVPFPSWGQHSSTHSFTGFSGRPDEEVVTQLEDNSKTVKRYTPKKSSHGNSPGQSVLRLLKITTSPCVDVMLYPSHTDHKPCDACASLISHPNMYALFGGSDANDFSSDVIIRCSSYNSRFTKHQSHHKKPVTASLCGGRIRFGESFFDCDDFHTFDISKVYFNVDKPEFSLEVYLNKDQKVTGDDFAYKKFKFVLSVESFEVLARWKDALFKSLDILVDIIDANLSSIDQHASWLKRVEHRECLLRKKARILETIKPPGDAEVLAAFKEVVKYLLETKSIESAELFIDYVDRLENENSH